LENLKARDDFEDLCLDGRIILKVIIMKEDVRMWTGLIWLKIGGQWLAVVNTVINLWFP
jgi:hypothetical protein